MQIKRTVKEASANGRDLGVGNAKLKLIYGLGLSLLSLSLIGCSDKSQHATLAASGFVKDSASSDTSVETLKTLTADISSVEEQNKKMVNQNNTLVAQDKTSIEQFKKDVQSEVQQEIAGAKTQLQAAQSTNQASSNNNRSTSTTNSNTTQTNPISSFVWVDDLQQTAGLDASGKAKSTTTPQDLASLLNPGVADKGMNNNNTLSSDNTNSNLILPTLVNTSNSKKPNTIPYYTIPVNSTLTGAIAMQPIIGRIPIDGKVPDPYTFKAIIGPKNLAANGVDIPSDIQGIVIAGVAEGDMLGRCARGDITSMTFVFQDGRISTTQAKDGSSLGTIAGANGNPCIAGTFRTDAGLYLGVTAGLSGLQGYGNALSQAQLNNSTSTTGATISSLVGNANTYAFGQAYSSSAQAAQKWWDQRVQNSFDFVYVANVDPKTNKKLQLNLNITQEIPIDYDPNGRKVYYDHQHNSFTPALD
jgi:integrating conjugative element protein (TIGR03752 family)